MVAEALSKKTGLKLQVLTTEPLVHFYTGQGFPKIRGKNNIEYGPYSGFCLETQKHPNAINIAKFPNTVLRPGEKYHQKNVYKISCLILPFGFYFTMDDRKDPKRMFQDHIFS